MTVVMDVPTDAALWDSARAGDAVAFGRLYERHARAVQAFCLRRTVELQVAEDMTSAVFLELWRKRARIDVTTATALPFLLGVATNMLHEHWRRRRRHDAAVVRIRNATPAEAHGHEDDTIARIDAIRELREARDALRALPRRELDVLSLVAWGDLSYEETAVALGVPVGTVRSRLSRARARLGEAFPAPMGATVSTEGS
ncbi:MAG TPA: sigma-70 family RNA polymerase sigma factor [Conexibacter sp.]|nr:sigma-70 family RNA polymerase sigma factor [Conexibacter sp.]